MRLLGLTGGIGMGKSTTANLMRQMDVAVVDTDDLARQVVVPGQPAWEEIRTCFGSEFIGSDGRLLRSELARKVFADAAARKTLEDILHPRIRALWLAQVEEWRRGGVGTAAVVIPLLYETGAETQFDAIICVACSVASQQERLLARSWTSDQIQARIAAQWPLDKKMAQADYVIWTEGGECVARAQLAHILSVSHV